MTLAHRLSGVSLDSARSGEYVLYWMQQAQRIEYNHALAFAIELANEQNLPLLLAFVVMPDVPDATYTHYRFMIQGITELMPRFRQMGIGFYVLSGNPSEVLMEYLVKSTALVMDVGYLNWQKAQRRALATAATAMGITFYEVESDALIPVVTLSDHEEFAAYSIRPKVIKQISAFLHEVQIKPPQRAFPKPQNPPKAITNFDACEPEDLLRLVHQQNSQTPPYIGGYSEARKHWAEFYQNRLAQYHDLHSDPAVQMESNLSPYLHFGQISSLEIVMDICRLYDIATSEIAALIKNRKSLSGLRAAIADFLEQLVVRRELGINFCHYCHNYDTYEATPLWAQSSLAKHAIDHRKPNYSLDILESAVTDDIYWNAAQTEMRTQGKMHNYMRMYWGKKIIEWTADPHTAHSWMLYLNNKYCLDGRDPNSYTGIAWCFGKHDRPWQERPIFGKVRYMNSAGLLRKFDMNAYLKRVTKGD